MGMLSARELHQAGCRVTLIERQQTGRESSWAGGGIISPLFPWRYLDAITRLASWSQQHYPALSEQLAKDTGIDPQYTQSGMLMVASDELDTAHNWAHQHGRELQLIDDTEFRALEPAAAHPPLRGLWMPTVGQIRNPRLAKAARADLQKRGVTVLTDQPVEKVLIEQGKANGVQTPGKTLHGDAVLICAGSWSGQLLGDLPTPPAINPVQGQMILFKTAPDTIRRITLEDQRYIIPRRDGHVLFGSSMEDVGFAKQTTDAMRDELRQIAQARFPVLKQYPLVKHWAGLRPGSPAGVPYIAEHPQIERLFVNSGQYRNGVVLGAASARLAADLILQRKPIVDPKPYSWTAARG